jgi:potassium-dependent mechanosensitive channel
MARNSRPPCILRLPGPATALLLPLLLVSGLAFAALPGLPGATTKAPETAEGAAKAPAIEAIPAADIPLRADADERFAQDVVKRTQGKDHSRQLGVELDRLTQGIVQLSKAFENENLRQLSAVRLESLDNHWRFYQRELDEWRVALDGITGPNTQDAAELAKRRMAWEATRDALSASGVTPALTDRVNVIIGQLGQAEQSLSAPLDEQMKLRQRANIVQASIDAGDKGVTAAIAYYDHRLRTIDAPPVWKAWEDTSFTASELSGTEAGLKLEAAFIVEWGAANQARVRAYRIGALALLPLLLWLAWRSRRTVTTEPAMQAAVKVLRRPFSAWLLLTLLGVLFFFPDAPIVLPQLALLLALVPMLRLLPDHVFQVLGRWPYVGTALYLLYRLSFLLLGHPLHYRLYTLGITLVAALVLVWLLLSSKQRHDRSGTPQPHGIVRVVAWSAVAALLVSALANVVGNVSLAEMQCSTAVMSAWPCMPAPMCWCRC